MTGRLSSTEWGVADVLLVVVMNYCLWAAFLGCCEYGGSTPPRSYLFYIHTYRLLFFLGGGGFLRPVLPALFVFACAW